MKFLGFEITRKKGLIPANSGSWVPMIREPYAGAWQLNDELTKEQKLAFSAVFSCITRISSDIGKLEPFIYKKEGGIKKRQENSKFLKVLKKPNGYQNHIQFKEVWSNSKLSHGNTYGLKGRNQRGDVVALYILDPTKVTPLVADDGSVFYQLDADNLSGIKSQVTVPASEIIHDRINCLFHPLVGLSPLYACSLSAGQGLAIQQNGKEFFANKSQPGGILTAPGTIKDETAKRLKKTWEQNYSGKNAGNVAVVGDGLKYESMTMTALDAQMVEQLKMSAETVCSVFHVPLHMVVAGQVPNYNNIEALTIQYYSQCLQSHIEQFELCLNEGLGLSDDEGVELDTNGLLRMDRATLAKTNADRIGAGYFAPNEARLTENLPPVEGGDTPYMQQQNYSLAALNARDELTDEEALSAMEEG